MKIVIFLGSPRKNGNSEAAAQLVAELPAFVTTVGLFVNPSMDEVTSVLYEVSLDLLQFHGDEPAEFCRQFGRPYIKAIRMREGVLSRRRRTANEIRD